MKRPIPKDETHRICPSKRCKHEGMPQPIRNFNKDRNGVNGHYRYCKSCTRESFMKYWHDLPLRKVETINPDPNSEVVKRVPIDFAKKVAYQVNTSHLLIRKSYESRM